MELAGIFYHLGENDMAFGPYRREAARWLQATVTRSRQDLRRPQLVWHVSQQTPPADAKLSRIDVTADVAAIAAGDPAFLHLPTPELEPWQEKLVVTTPGIIRLGELLAASYLRTVKTPE